jgi:hypothetical protein
MARLVQPAAPSRTHMTIHEGGPASSGPDVRRLTAVFGLASVVLWLGQFPLYMQDDPSVSVYDGAGLVRDLYRVQNAVFTRILLNLGACITGMIFAAGLGQLIKQAGPGQPTSGSAAWSSARSRCGWA